MAPPSLCGGALNSRRGLLASLWSVVVVLTFLAFIIALIFTLSASNMNNGNDENNNYYNNENEHEQDRDENTDPEMAVTSRAMAFCALWTAVLATLMAIFGAVILGWQSPLSGIYYTCCSPQVHRTTPLALGSFIGALMMFANLTLVCSVLFGEFDIRDYKEGGGEDKDAAVNDDTAVRRSSMAFSIMCMFLTVLYAGFAGLTFAFSKSVLEELFHDDNDEMALSSSNRNMKIMPHNTVTQHYVGGHFNDGYIGERFDVRRPNSVVVGGGGFTTPAPDTSII